MYLNLQNFDLKINLLPVVSNPRFDPRNSNELPVLLGMSCLVCPINIQYISISVKKKFIDDP